MNYDYLLEKKLKQESPELSEQFASVAFVMSRILEKRDIVRTFSRRAAFP